MWSSVTEQITNSSLTPSGQPSAIIIGTASKGTVNTAYTIGKKSDITELFGEGELPDTITYMQKTMSDVSILAVRVQENIEVTTSDDIEIIGEPIACVDCNISVQSDEITIVSTGEIEFEKIIPIPDDGVISLEELGLTIAIDTTSSDSWSFSTSALPVSFETIEETINNLLEVYTPEIIAITQPVDVEFVKTLGVTAERLFEDHKPTLFLTHTELDSSVSYSEAIANKQIEFAKIDARFVSVVCQPLADESSALGLCLGHIVEARVNQSIGATNYFGISEATLPDGWTNVHSRALDDSRFITLRTYAGLSNIFWTNGRTMAGSTSDYRFIEVVRTVFKAIKLARLATLPYIQADGDDIGLQNLLAEVRNAIEGMVTTNPKELDSYEVELPSGQDIANNGVQLEISLYGIPIIRTILLNFVFRYNSSE